MPETLEQHGELFDRLAHSDDPAIEPLVPVLVPDSDEPMGDDDIATLVGGFLPPQHFPGTPGYRRFLGIARRAPNVEWLHFGHAGLDAPIYAELMDKGVTLTNSSGAASEPIAQSVMAGVLALHRGVPRWLEQQRRHVWERIGDADAKPELRTQTITIFGLGAIGTYVANFARAFGMHVVGVRRRPAGLEDGVDEWVHTDQLLEVLPRTDWLIVTVPLTGDTYHVIDAEAFARLPQGAHIVNIARGAVIDEAAMVESLQSGHLGGAYLDVFEVEPLPEDSPLWDMPNVIISPHNSAPSSGNDDRVQAIFLAEFERWLHGEPLQRIVRDRGPAPE
jgi:phosphoglycerate dehydrogenase-like enzyme